MIGVGGLGCPAAHVIAKSALPVSLTLLDDDVIDASNLQRQILFDDADVGQSKAEVAARKLSALGADAAPMRARLYPDNAEALFAEHDLVIEGADNYPTKFLAADAAAITNTPLVSAGAVQWRGWALASAPGHACLRCVFEDVPSGDAPTCEDAGVVGPVVGVLGAISAGLALAIVSGRAPYNRLHAYRGLRGQLRASRVKRREECPSCSGAIADLDSARYQPQGCAA